MPEFALDCRLLEEVFGMGGVSAQREASQDLWANVTKTNETLKLAEDHAHLKCKCGSTALEARSSSSISIRTRLERELFQLLAR